MKKYLPIGFAVVSILSIFIFSGLANTANAATCYSKRVSVCQPLACGSYNGPVVTTTTVCRASPPAPYCVGKPPCTSIVFCTILPPESCGLSSPQPAITLSPTSFSFTAPQGGANPAGKVLTITNSGDAGTTLNWTAAKTQPWLTLSKASGALATGASDQTTLTVNIAGLAVNTYSDTITVSDPNAKNSPQTATVTLTISSGAPTTGTITVTSQSSVAPHNPVSASWEFAGPDDPCASAPCSGSSQPYTKQTPGNYIIASLSASGYAFRDSSINHVAMRHSFFGELLALGKDILVPQAKAYSVSPIDSQTLAAGGNITFTINWDPLASILVSPASLALTSSNAQGSVDVSNNGTTGSGLTWNSSIVYSANSKGKSWLTPSKTNDGTELKTIFDGGSADTVNFTVDQSGLGLDTYHATDTITGVSSPGGHGISSKTISVSFTKTSLTCPGDPGCAATPSCNLTPSPTQVIVPGSSTLSYTGTNVATCSPITGSDGSSNPTKAADAAHLISGDVSAYPTQNTTYSFSCQGLLPGPAYTCNASASVSVQNPGVIECAPGQKPPCN